MVFPTTAEALPTDLVDGVDADAASRTVTGAATVGYHAALHNQANAALNAAPWPVAAYGVPHDAVKVTDAVLGADLVTLTSASGAFATAAAGMAVTLAGGSDGPGAAYATADGV